MTALEQALMQEVEQEKAMNTNLLSKLEKQEKDFLEMLQNQQKLYENNISKIVGNYQINLSKIVSNYEYNIIQNTKEMKTVQKEHENTVSNILEEIKKILDTDITSGETGQSYYEQLQSLKKQIWGIQEGQKELRTSLANITIKMFPSQT